ncbi:DNA-processing protein DprA [Rehaibacterium terrae]|jgi:DNA processing protein
MAAAMPHDSALPAWPLLLRAAGGRAALRRLVEVHGDAEAAVAAGPRAWRAAGLDEDAVARLRAPDPDRLARDRDWLAQPGHHLIGWDSPDYPALLRRIPSPPPALWVVGDPDWLWHPQVAIVGSRSPTATGADNAHAFARAFAQAGLTVASGLARGIDAAAHLGALAGGGATVAVMGTGPDQVYPGAHRELAARIAAHGCLVSEHPPGTGPRREHFPSRNRIVAGLALGVLVVEAATRSGALITARLAGEAGREVFAVPGSIHNPLARGCHALIRQGAALVEEAGEVVQALAPVAAELAEALRGRLSAAAAAPTFTAQTSAAVKLPADPDYQRLWDALGHDPAGLDELSGRTGLTVGVLSSMLLLMELEGLVTADHGRYARRP